MKNVRNTATRSLMRRMGGSALSVVPTMLKGMKSAILVLLLVVFGVAVVSGIAGDFVGAIRAEVAEWRLNAEAEVDRAQANNDFQEAFEGAASSTIPTERRGQVVAVSSIMDGADVAFRPLVSDADRSAFKADLQMIVVGSCGVDRCSREQVGQIVTGGQLKTLFDGYGLPADKAQRMAAVAETFAFDRLNIRFDG